MDYRRCASGVASQPANENSNRPSPRPRSADSHRRCSSRRLRCRSWISTARSRDIPGVGRTTEASMEKRPEPSAESIKKIRNYVEKYWQKSGTSGHPDAEVTEAVTKGLAANMEEVGRPLCPCNFYP